MSVKLPRRAGLMKAKSMPAFSEEIMVMSIMLPPLCHALILYGGQGAPVKLEFSASVYLSY